MASAFPRPACLPSVALAAVTIACSGSPTASSPPEQTTSASPEATVLLAPTPSPAASMVLAADVLAQCPPESASKEPVTFEVQAAEGMYDPATLRAPACTPIEITFTNAGALRNIRHNIAIPLGVDQWLFRGERALTTEPIDYAIPPLPSGEYTFRSEAGLLNGTLEVLEEP